MQLSFFSTRATLLRRVASTLVAGKVATERSLASRGGALSISCNWKESRLVDEHDHDGRSSATAT